MLGLVQKSLTGLANALCLLKACFQYMLYKHTKNDTEHFEHIVQRKRSLVTNLKKVQI